MTPAEFHQARLRLGLSLSQCATVFGVTKRTVQFWEADDGKRPVHGSAAKLMAAFLSGYRPPEWPA